MEILSKERLAYDLGFRVNSDYCVVDKKGKFRYVNDERSNSGTFEFYHDYKRYTVQLVRLFVFQHIQEELYSVGRVRVIDQNAELTMDNLRYERPTPSDMSYVKYEVKELQKQLEILSANQKDVVALIEDTTKRLEQVSTCIQGL